MNFTNYSRREILQFLGVCVGPLAAALPLAIWQKSPQEEPLEFDQGLRKRLRAKPPEVALLGNSMIHGRMDSDYLVERLQPLTTAPISIGATRSLQWFLWLKNQVVPCRPYPRVVFIFYRDYDFHNLGRSISDRLLKFIRQTMVAGDEAFLRRARGRDKSKDGIASMRDWLDHHYKTIAMKEHLSKKLSDNAYDAASLLGPLDDRPLKTHVESVFGLQNLRSGAQPIAGEDTESDEGFRTVFTDLPADTLLSDFVRVADEAGIKLVFYHVKRRPDETGVRKVPGHLATYTAALKAWVETRGHYHFNETDDPSLTLDMYQDADHLKTSVARAYTDSFIARVSHLLPKPFTPAEIEAGRKEMKALDRAATPSR
jgi:hypothetical protein